MNATGQKVRVAIIGSKGCGKRCLLRSYWNKAPQVDELENECNLMYRNEIMQIETNSNFQFQHVDVFILCYAVNDVKCFHNALIEWRYKIKGRNVPYILVGLKSDLKARPDFDGVRKSEARIRVQDTKAHAFFECSAKYMVNVEAIFEEALIIYKEENRNETVRAKSSRFSRFKDKVSQIFFPRKAIQS